jgi:putative Mg2+ transporter-C (MgtC) family protein
MALFEGAFTPDSLHQAAYVLAKIGIGAVLAGVIGWEREVHGRPAGMRTHILLVIGVVLMCEVSRVFGGGDPARIAAQIVTGVGFLGAGAIMRMGVEIKGLTSAASLWTVTGIGMAVSVGGAFLVVAIVATVISVFTLGALSWFEKRFLSNNHPRQLLVVASSKEAMSSLVGACQGGKAVLRGVRVVRDDLDLEVVLELTGDPERILAQVLAVVGVREARWIET